MAEGPDPVSETVLELEQEVTCGICHDHYQEPKLLPCCHYYCKQCILTLSSQYRPNQPFPCPDCREPTLLPGNDADRLPTAFFINRMKELHSKMEKAHNKSDTPQKCVDHDEPQKIFCFDCERLICRDCVLYDHRDHKSEFVNRVAPETRKKLAEHLLPLKNLLPDLSTAVSRVRDTKQKIQDEGKLVEKQVNEKFQELHDILEQCKASALRKSCSIIENKMQKLTTQENGLDLSMGRIQSLVDFVEHTLNNASDEELVTMQEQVMSRIDAEVVKRGKEAASADPVEKADFGVEVSVSEDLKRLCESNVVVCADKFFVRGDGTRIAEVDEPARLTLHFVKDIKPPAIQATLESLVDQTSLQLEAVPMRRGVYSIEYVPKVRGRHHLLISVDGQPITGSPFSVFVRIHPTKLHKPVREIGSICDSLYLAFNSAEELIVSYVYKNAAILNKRGERLRSVSKSQPNAYGVAVDKDDNIYVSDSERNCVCKLDKNGELLKRIGRKGGGPGEFRFVRGIAVAGERLFVCDRDNHRVQVLTTDLEPVMQFGSKGTGDGQFNEPGSVAVDDGLLFVSDCLNHRVQVFTGDGQFVQTFGKKGSQLGELASIRGVCVDAGCVYVVEFNKKRVSVFAKDGRFITLFGDSRCSDPVGVSVDSDGFVYVCCRNRVVVF